ncbi:flagellar hook assembly protein FlgD [Primorskyibacter aestuariivivens]|uniref:flagellar hook capping FlgD N-terminal domain-containing protein n=1 Tax=Primorskyibacter aestuariivivens TaxID=1888912 RepID=UPI0022FFE0C1|nr:flagellar hook capping FlgD N-terminal domain-containing protein [Primorskyibacter aestuariivivens]MDA7430212.1 flagellar hook assembly protein FlgD [Primorskyibacter aestuariivivens]
MTISATQSPPSLFNTGAAPSSSNSTVLNSDFNTFLQMLTTQMMNQDPLNPIDSSDYAAQLAAFSSVEQQVVTNSLLEDMAGLLGVGGLAEVSTWVGRDVRSEAPAYFDGEPLELAVTVALQADQSVLEVYDQNGDLVQTTVVDPDSDSVIWAGVDENGTPFPSGEYSFVVDNLVDDESIGLTSVHTYNEVIEARSQNGQIVLVLEGGRLLSVDSVSGIRA